MLKLGSLFDGSGTCPLAAQMCGITPAWASEIESFPVAVTTSRFPSMKHLGDITKINGAEIEPVDIITFGSPCQNLSIAGNRKGLEGEESSLFLEAVRIIREMRDATDGRYPQICMWENVMGAFSSNKGSDFQRVIEELCSICEPGISIPRPAKWSKSGSVVGDTFSFAWRSLNAEHWGVPQRRRRIFAVLDLGGQCAGEILFERESCTRDFTQILGEGQTSAGTAEGGTGEQHRCYAVENHPCDSRVRLESSDVIQTLNGRMGTGGGNVPLLISPLSSKSPTTLTTLKASGGNYGGGTENLIMSRYDMTEISGGELPMLVRATGQANSEVGINCVPTLNCTHETPFVTFPFQRREYVERFSDGGH